MRIDRLRVEPEGFLAGLDVAFTPGLNVIIGARGTGKTSIVELLRWCLGAPGLTRDAIRRGEQQTVAILAGASASVLVGSMNGPRVFTRSENSSPPSPTPEVTVLAQNEIETIGAQASGRLFLIDRLRRGAEEQEHTGAALDAQVRSVTAQMSAVRSEIITLTQGIPGLAELEAKLASARQRQTALLQEARATREEQEQLREIERSGVSLAGRLVTTEGLLDEFDRLGQDLIALEQAARQALDSERLRSVSDDTKSAIQQTVASLAAASTVFISAHELIQGELADVNALKQQLDMRARALRQRLESMQSGLGSATRQVQEFEEQLGQLQATRERVRVLGNRLAGLGTQRDQLYDQADQLRQSKYEQRLAVAAELNTRLRPQVRVRVEQARQTADYEAAVIAALKGSGLHYNSLAPAIVRAASPYELATWAERGAVAELSSALGITSERAMSILQQIHASGTENLICARVDDVAIFELLDGRDYKTSDRLSIGQRCTVVLPILLDGHGSPLVIDQPEDHLDNAFIAQTLVRSLLARDPGDQYIFVTHNANIPVLANADNVVVLGSDGDRGYVQHQGPLDDPRIVELITKLMEGGREAFSARARFYGGHFG